MPGSVESAYVPLDSLRVGFDTALRVLKMKREDLTFRGDYLERDYYRIPKIDSLMLNPLDLVEFAEGSFGHVDSLSWLVPGGDYMGDKNIGKSSDDSRQYKQRDEYMKINSLFEDLEGQGISSDFFELCKRIISAGLRENPDIFEASGRISTAGKDSIIEGFTLLLEENIEDEFSSVEEIDSLSRYEDDWAERLAELAGGFRGCRKDYEEIVFSFDSAIMKNPNGTIPLSAMGFKKVSEFGQIIIGDTTDNHYEGNLFMVIDPGGDDTYDIEFEGTGHHTYIIDYAAKAAGVTVLTTEIEEDTYGAVITTGVAVALRVPIGAYNINVLSSNIGDYSKTVRGTGTLAKIVCIVVIVAIQIDQKSRCPIVTATLRNPPFAE